MYRDVARNFLVWAHGGALHKISLDHFEIKGANSFSGKFLRTVSDIHFTQLKTNQIFKNLIYNTYYNDRLGKKSSAPNVFK